MQLFGGLRHLETRNVIHANIKPDNFLVSSDFSIVQLCDFDSAFEVSSADVAIPTPYLVSRFYRAPEIILGMSPTTTAIDIRSIGVTAAELFIETVLFNGISNSNMLQTMIEQLGVFSSQTLRQHLIQVRKLGGNSTHFRWEQASVYAYLQ